MAQTPLIDGSQAQVSGYVLEGNGIEVFSFAVIGVPDALSEDGHLDGMGDRWEWLFFGALTEGYYGDADSDGFLNGEEYHRGTDPGDGASSPEGVPLTPVFIDGDVVPAEAGEGFVLVWSGAPDGVHVVEISTDGTAT